MTVRSGRAATVSTSRHPARIPFAVRALFRLRLVYIILVTGAVGACAEGQRSKMPSPAAASESSTTSPFYFGRFRMHLPYDVEVRGQQVAVQDMTIREFSWPVDSAGRRAVDAFDAVWDARVQELRADPMRRPRDVPDVIFRTLQVAPGVRLMLRYDDRHGAEARYVEVLADNGSPVGAWVRINYDVSIDPTADQIAVELVPPVARAYRPQPRKELRDESIDAFHLRDGAVVLPYDHQESVQTQLRVERLNAEINIELETTRRAEEEGLIARWRGMRRMTAVAPDLASSTVRARKRTVAGLRGEEVVGVLSEPGESATLTLTWEYAGQADSGERPSLQISMTSDDSDRDVKLAYWDRLLETIEALPQAGTR